MNHDSRRIYFKGRPDHQSFYGSVLETQISIYQWLIHLSLHLKNPDHVSIQFHYTRRSKGSRNPQREFRDVYIQCNIFIFNPCH